MAKGFIFTLDSALAAVLSIVLLIVTINLLSVNTGTYFGKLQLASIGNDFLAVLDLNSSFDRYVDQSQSFVLNDLQSHMTTLPPNYCANVTVSTYDYSSGSFALDDQYVVTKTGCTTTTSEPVKVKRVFISFTPEKYGKVEMTLWLR